MTICVTPISGIAVSIPTPAADGGIDPACTPTLILVSRTLSVLPSIPTV
ncbi:MAG TPA: hypothetical protein VJL59_12720 [Anaerolineales bacterium]|nr:hypothetical protein [Anaerolineales bacterium]